MKTKRILAITLLAICSLLLFISAHTPSKNVLEQPLLVEDWMTQPFVDSIDEPLEVEDWMTQPFTVN